MSILHKQYTQVCPLGKEPSSAFIISNTYPLLKIYSSAKWTIKSKVKTRDDSCMTIFHNSVVVLPFPCIQSGR